MKKPEAENKELQRLIDQLWTSSPNPIGDGSTADAIRHEIKTGQPVKERDHSQKGKDSIRALEKWLAKKTSPKPDSDKKIAREIIKDLKNALKGK